MVDRILKIISGGNLPRQHRDLTKISSISNTSEKVRVVTRLFVVHPVKRRFAKAYLALLRRSFGLKVIGITGSAGKTTTKEMLSSILRQKGNTVASYKNIDPIYNIPTTILRCTPFTKYLVLEMGVEFPGEMDFYLWLASPDVGIITNIYPTHLEFFKTEEGVFSEKRKLVQNLKKDSVAVLNKQNKYLKGLKASSKIIWFGEDGDLKAEIFSKSAITTSFKLTYDNDEVEVKLPVFGSHFVENALAAATAAVGLGFGLDEISNGLSNFQSAEHRMKVIEFGKGIRVFDDTYNNNPAAATASIQNFMDLDKSRRKIIVFGDMLELGEMKINYHKQIGQLISNKKPYALICFGELAKYTGSVSKIKNVHYTNAIEETTITIEKLVKANTDILIKGSRSMHLDSLVAKLHF